MAKTLVVSDEYKLHIDLFIVYERAQRMACTMLLQFNAIWALCCVSIHCIKCRFRGICVWMLNVECVRLVPFIPIYYPLWRDIMNKIINEFELHSIERTQLDRWPAFSRRFFTTEESYMGLVIVPACIFALCVAVVVVDVEVCVCVFFFVSFLSVGMPVHKFSFRLFTIVSFKLFKVLMYC